MSSKFRRAIILLSLGAVMPAGCAMPRQFRVTRQRLSVSVDPAGSTISGRSEMTVSPADAKPVGSGRVEIALDLHEALTVDAVRVAGGALKRVSERAVPRDESETGDSEERKAGRVRRVLVVDHASEEMTITMEYGGRLWQDIEKGEKAGQIHNFTVDAHVSPEGTYLAPEGHWYPEMVFADERTVDPGLLLCDWDLRVKRIPDYSLVASGMRTSAEGEDYVWRSAYPQTGMTLTGGPHDVWSERVGDVEVSVHMKRADSADGRAENERVARNYIGHVGDYIARYEPLLGAFPYGQYTVVENFFSSGFAFPMMTLFGPIVMHMGDNSFRHGYLDHELVHSWWGCGVDVDPRDGNWCEALTTYCTNYYGHVLDDAPDEARKQRRNYSNFLSRLEPKDDKPLGTYGLPDGAGRGIAYSKGAAVFQMLARRIGQDHFWEACRDLTKRFTGRHASWEDLRAAFERSSGQNLGEFFGEWVRMGGAPRLTLDRADYDSGSDTLTVLVRQDDLRFDPEIPLRLDFDGETTDVNVRLDLEAPGGASRSARGGHGAHAREGHSDKVCSAKFRVDRAPVAVELDPDYLVFRKLKPSEIMPTTATTRSSKSLTIVLPEGSYPEAYDTVADEYKPAEKADDSKSKSKKRVVEVRADSALGEEALRSGGVLILGDAARHPAVQALLGRAGCPIRWSLGGFSVGDREFTEPRFAVLCTLHHPDSEGDGVTVYFGNSAEALGNAGILGFYANSMLVFETKGRTQVALRKDFESQQRVDVSVH